MAGDDPFGLPHGNLPVQGQDYGELPHVSLIYFIFMMAKYYTKPQYDNLLAHLINSRRRDTVTQSEYFKYCLHPRSNETNYMFMAGKLLQEYMVDAWATTEQRKLIWIKTIRTKFEQTLIRDY